MKTILCHTSPRSIDAASRRALARLGYQLVDVPRGADSPTGAPEPALRIVDEARLRELPDPETSPDAALVLVVSRGSPGRYDPRVRGILERPARFDRIYTALQEALETTPRRWPRIGTTLSARGLSAGRTRPGAVLSLSRQGCLFRCAEPLDASTVLDLQLALPQREIVATQARCVYRNERGMGLEFTKAFERSPVSRFLSRELLA